MIFTDDQLYELCRKYGEQARLWRQKFAGLLPEVLRRGLHLQKGFHSIFEFAKKLAGMSEEQVRRVLSLEKSFEDKPILKAMLENGEVSIHKLARVSSVATVENQEFWAAQVKILPKRALETLVKDEKQKPTFDTEFVPGHKIEENLKELKLSNELIKKLYELQRKGIDINAVLLDFLKQRENAISAEKEKVAAAIQPTNSRYIPIKIRKILYQEHGTKCSMQYCTKLAQAVHHTQRFSLSKNHNPKFLAPLCKEHHTIAHAIDLKFQFRQPVASGLQAYFDSG